MDTSNNATNAITATIAIVNIPFSAITATIAAIALIAIILLKVCRLQASGALHPPITPHHRRPTTASGRHVLSGLLQAIVVRKKRR